MRFAHAPILGLVTSVVAVIATQGLNELRADDGPRVVRIEETWELQLAEPDSNNTAPQVTCCFSPLRNLSSLHATFELNHLATPEFSPGGLHLHAFNGDQRLGSQHEGTGSLRTTGEVVRWKQVMTLNNGELAFEIIDGSSTTWGSFGGNQSLRIAVPTSLTSLNSYSPSVSVSQSGIGFAGNRVSRLHMTHCKAITSSGLVLEDSTDRTVHTLE